MSFSTRDDWKNDEERMHCTMGTRDDWKNDEERMHCTMESLESEEGKSLVSKKCNRKLVPDQVLILNTRRSRIYATNCEFFFQNVHGLHSSIPKHITSFDEKYALRCFELILNYAIRSEAWNFSMKGEILPGDLNNFTEGTNRRSSCEMVSIAVECPVAFETEAMVNSSHEWTIAAVTQSQSVINILKSPLLQQFGSLDSDVSFDITSLPSASESVASPNGLISKSSRKLQKEMTVLNYKYHPTHVHNRVASMSSTNSSSSDQSCLTPSAMYQGMLQCKWKDGLPHYVFTVDDTRDVYVANLSKVESVLDKDLDCVYVFQSRENSKKEYPRDLDLKSVGNMKVSSSVTVCSDNSEVVETQFILLLSSDSHLWETQTSKHTFKKNERLTKKVRGVFRSSHSHKHKSCSKFQASNAIYEDTSLDPSEDTKDGLDTCAGSVENKCIQNFESAAIIIKDRVFNNNKVADHGGWGMKFLKKSGKNSSLETLMPSRSAENSPECSSAINVIIPAGFHGGPRTRNGGPSSLIERWVSGGCCDCGGWDTGCPLTILNTKSSCPDSSPSADNSQECSSTDLFIQGSKQNVPIMRMVNIHDGLYYIHFQSTLSILQSFAIATAILHSRSSVFRSRLYRS